MTQQRKIVWCAAGTKVGAQCANRALPGKNFCGTHFNMAVQFDPTRCGGRLAKGGQCSRKPMPGYRLCRLHWGTWMRGIPLMHPGAERTLEAAQ